LFDIKADSFVQALSEVVSVSIFTLSVIISLSVCVIKVIDKHIRQLVPSLLSFLCCLKSRI